MLNSEQLEQRMLGVGGSDAPVLAGIDPYKQPLDLYLEKIGASPPVDNLEEINEPVRWGNLLECVIADEWAQRHCQRVMTRKDPFIHPEHDFIRGNVDRLLVDKEEGLEIKARGTFAAEEYGPSVTDQVKESDIIQCTHYMACTGYQTWHMAVLIGGQELRSYTIPRDESLVASLIDLECKFWSAVERREPPDLDFSHRSTPSLIKKMFPGTNGKTVVLDDRAVTVAREIERLSADRRDTEKALKALKNERDAILGNSAIGVLPDGSGGWSRRQVDRSGYRVEPTSFTGVYFSKKHKG